MMCLTKYTINLAHEKNPFYGIYSAYMYFGFTNVLVTTLIFQSSFHVIIYSLNMMSGCDTTSRLFGQNKMDILKMASQEGKLAYIADQFLASTSRENVQRHGKRAMFMIYNGCKTECTDLDTLRHIQFEDKAASSFTHVSCSSLPPTSAATAFHALRVYYQIQVWLNLGDKLNVLDWGWKMSNGKLCPIHTDLPPAPSGVLQVIRCGCKGDCASFRCSCKKHGLECSTACRECRGSSCANTGFTASDTADTA